MDTSPFLLHRHCWTMIYFSFYLYLIFNSNLIHSFFLFIERKAPMKNVQVRDRHWLTQIVVKSFFFYYYYYIYLYLYTKCRCRCCPDDNSTEVYCFALQLWFLELNSIESGRERERESLPPTLNNNENLLESVFMHLIQSYPLGITNTFASAIPNCWCCCCEIESFVH